MTCGVVQVVDLGWPMSVSPGQLVLQLFHEVSYIVSCGSLQTNIHTKSQVAPYNIKFSLKVWARLRYSYNSYRQAVFSGWVC